MSSIQSVNYVHFLKANCKKKRQVSIIWPVAFILILPTAGSLCLSFFHPRGSFTAAWHANRRRSAYLCLADHAMSVCRMQERHLAASACAILRPPISCKRYAIRSQSPGWQQRCCITNCGPARVGFDARVVREVMDLHGNQLQLEYITT